MPLDGGKLSPEALMGLRALELLRERGWCQKRAYGYNGQLCLLGAFHEAGLRRASERLNVGEMTTFNDAVGRTFEEIEGWLLDRIAAEIAS